MIRSWASPEAFFPEESPRKSLLPWGSVVRLLVAFRRSPSLSTKLGRSQTGLFHTFVLGVNWELLKLRAGPDLCVTPMSVCVLGCPAVPPTRTGGWTWKHWAPTPVSADISRESRVDSEQIFWQCHVCVLCCLVWNGACSCKRAAQQPSASLPQPHATKSLQEW